MEVRRLGRLVPVDGDGYIVRDVDASHLRPPWDAALADIRAASRDHWGERLHSLYVRGSLPRGFAVEGVSDIDCYAFLHDDDDEIDRGWIEAACRELDARHPFQTGIEIIPFSLKGILDPAPSGLYRILQFSVGSNCLCIYGEDLGPRLPRFRPGPEIAVRAANLPSEMETARAALAQAKSADEAKEWCGWIMKRIVRTGFELVMEREQAYTRDLYFCYEAFARHYPEHKRRMYRCLELAVQPSADATEILAVMAGLGAWVIDRATRYRRGG